ncbi:MAG: threonine/serine exporter family protein [Clostridiales bacterium]|nr:threonine/serine exporter family protein [Clostridiales bacterium]
MPRTRMKVLAFAVSAGFFSVMFGGGLLEFFLAAVAGALVQCVSPLLSRLRAPATLISIAGGFTASAATLALITLFGGNQEPVITGAIMPLLPGLAATNALRDTMRGDLVSGMARTTEALLSAVLIAAGVAIALML